MNYALCLFVNSTVTNTSEWDNSCITILQEGIHILLDAIRLHIYSPNNRQYGQF